MSARIARSPPASPVAAAISSMMQRGRGEVAPSPEIERGDLGLPRGRLFRNAEIPPAEALKFNEARRTLLLGSLLNNSLPGAFARAAVVADGRFGSFAGITGRGRRVSESR